MSALHPSILLVAGAVLAAVAPRRALPALTVAAAAGALVAAVALPSDATITVGYYGYELTVLRADALALPFAWAFGGLILLGAVFGWGALDRLERVAALATAAAGIGVVLAGDLLTLFFFWEAKVTTAVLLISARRSARSAPASLRYLGVHLVGGVLLLAGTVWHLVDTGSLEATSIGLSGPGALMLVGVLVSAASLPLGAWLPDAYPEASIAATVVLSAFTTKAAVYVLVRAFPGVELLVWVGAITSVVAVAYAVVEDDLRRLLGYHIVSQVGFMVAAVGIGTSNALAGAVGHATAHIFYKGLLLMAVGAVIHATGRTRISELGGLAGALPWVLVLYLVGAASIAGMPGFSGFPAKELSVGSVSSGGQGAAAWVLKVASVGTFLSVACKLPWFTWFGRRREPAPTVGRVPVTMYLAMGVAAVVNVGIGLRPAWFYDQLPGTVSFAPYQGVKVADALVLAAVVALGFWLARDRLAPAAKVNLDTDAAYRELPRWLVARPIPVLAGTVAAARRSAGPALADGRARAVGAVVERSASLRSGGPVAPSWLLGGTIAAAMVVVLAASVLS